MRALKRDRKSNLELFIQEGNLMVKKLPQVTSFVAWRDPLQVAPCATGSSEPEENKERKRHYTEKTLEDPDTPELVAFFQEHNYQFTKAFFMEAEVPSLNKCLVENCEMDRNMVNSDVDNNSDSDTTLETMSSMSNESKLGIANNSRKNVIRKCGSENLMMEYKEDFDARDARLIDCFLKEIFPEGQQVRKFASSEADLSNSMVASATEAIEANNHTSRSSSETREENGRVTHLDTFITTADGKEEFQHIVYFQPLPETKSISNTQDGMSESLAGSNQAFVHQHGQGESNFFSVAPLSGLTVCSRETLHSGSISLQSNSSTASSQSFVFPILPSEWNGSPVRMAKADRRQLRKLRWRKFFPCCNF